MKTKNPDMFVETIGPILRAARAEGATAAVLTASFIQSVERVYGLGASGAFRPAAQKPKKPKLKALLAKVSKSNRPIGDPWEAPVDDIGSLKAQFRREDQQLRGQGRVDEIVARNRRLLGIRAGAKSRLVGVRGKRFE